MLKISQLLNKPVILWAKLKDFLLSLPSGHKKRFYQAVGLYLLVVFLIAGWLVINSDATLKKIDERSPKAAINIEKIKALPGQQAAGPKQEKIAAAAADTNPTPADTNPTPAAAETIAAENTPAKTPNGFNEGKIAFEQKYISIIIPGLALSKDLTEKTMAANLPKTFSLSFSPYAGDVKDWIEKATKLGYEAIIEAPMESVSYPEKDPGPKALSSRLSDSKNKENIDWILNRGKGASAVMNFMGSRFLNDKQRLDSAFQKINQGHLIFIEKPTGKKSKAEETANKIGLPYLKVDANIGHTPNKDIINKELDKLEELANSQGYAIAVVEAYPFTLEILKTWANKLSKHDIVLTNIETLWRNRLSDDKRNYNISRLPE